MLRQFFVGTILVRAAILIVATGLAVCCFAALVTICQQFGNENMQIRWIFFGYHMVLCLCLLLAKYRFVPAMLGGKIGAYVDGVGVPLRVGEKEPPRHEC